MFLGWNLAPSWHAETDYVPMFSQHFFAADGQSLHTCSGGGVMASNDVLFIIQLVAEAYFVGKKHVEQIHHFLWVYGDSKPSTLVKRVSMVSWRAWFKPRLKLYQWRKWWFCELMRLNKSWWAKRLVTSSPIGPTWMMMISSARDRWTNI